MKKEDFYGKYITGENGPVEITEELCKNHKILTKRILEHLNKEGLLHDSFEKAYIAQGLKDGSMIRESDIAYADAYADKQKSIYIKRIYISGPISGHDINERRAEFQRAEYEMICRGVDPVNPMKNGLPAEATTHEHMKRDIELLMTCDLIYMMRHWTHSKGCKVEFDVATAIGLPVLFEESGEIIEFV